MPSYNLAIDCANLLVGADVFVLVDEKPIHAYDVLGFGAGLCQNQDRILQCLANLPDEIGCNELPLSVPANHATDKDKAPACCYAVRIAFRTCPICRLEIFHVLSFLSSLLRVGLF